MFRLSLWKEID